MITLSDIKALVATWDADKLARVNPLVSDVWGSETYGCRATYPDGTHCVVAQIFTELGLAIPDPNSMANYTDRVSHWPGRQSVEQEAVDTLWNVQMVADTIRVIPNDTGSTRYTWGESLAQYGLL